MRLSDLSAGRDNNLNLLRFLTAFAVVVAHSFALSKGTLEADPLMRLTRMPIGAVAVDVFFLLSGFLVTGSILRTKSLLEFSVARVLRIFPGLLVMLMLTVFGLGLAFTTLPAREYLQSAQTFSYLAQCATLFAGIAFELPGVFQDTPFKGSVNGSLWTLPYEVYMYVTLACTWLLCAAFKRSAPKAFAASCVAVMALSALALLTTLALNGEGDRSAMLFFMFFTGASFRVLQARVVLKTSAALLLGAALAAAAATASKTVFFLAYLLSLPYLAFYLAHVPRGAVRRYNRAGDFSYGMYVYAFPIQQSLVTVMPGISPLPLMAWSGSITLLFAVPSWFLVEKPAMRLRGRLVQRLMGARRRPDGRAPS